MCLPWLAMSLFALAALDPGVDLIGASVQQLDGAVFQFPDIAVRLQARILLVRHPLARNQLRTLEADCAGLCYHQRGLRASRAGRQAKADQPNRERPCCSV